MEYIDKQNNKQWAHTLLDDFLTRCRQNGEPIPEDLYKALQSDRKGRFHTFQCYSEKILAENEYRCCYCMRRIKKHPVSNRYPLTLEHVIVRTIISQSDYDAYFSMESDLEKKDMILASNFENSSKYPPYPHTIAYENLIPSCRGDFLRIGTSSKTCNHCRGNEFVHPLVFRKNIRDEIRYYSDGTVEWTADRGDGRNGIPYVNLLGLNYIDLRLIRRIWYYLTHEHLDYNSKETKIHVFNIIVAELSDEDEESREILENLQKIKNDDYWKLVGDYDYFKQSDLFSVRERN